MVTVNIRGTKGDITSHRVSAGKGIATVIQVPEHGKFTIELVDAKTGHGPQVLTTKRVGNNLVLSFDGEENSEIVLEDYYLNDEVHLVGQAENGQYYEYIPVSGEVNDYAPVLADGMSSDVALGGEPSAGAAPAEDDNQFAWLPFLLLGAGAAGIATAAYVTSKNKDSDSSKPEISIVIHPATDKDNDGRPEISGSSSSPDSNVVITFPDGKTITTKTDENGNWSIEAPSSQPNGSVTVTVTDSDGNSSTVTGKLEDNTAPGKPTISANDDTQLAGTAEPGSKVTVTDKETGETTTVVADEEGKWSIQPNPISEEGKDASVVAEDPAGNVSPPVNVTRPDTTAPDNISSGIVIGSISLIDDVAPVTGVIADGGKTNDTRPTYTGKATGDIDHVNIYDNGKLAGSAKVGSDGRWTYTPKTSLAEGSTHEYSVAAVDKSGNEGARVSGTSDAGWTFTVDTLPPDNKTSGIVVDSITLIDDVEQVTGVIKDGDKTNDTRPTYSGKATGDIDSVNIYDNGSLVASVKVNGDGSWSYTPEKALANGSSHEYSVSAVDKSGNEGSRVSGTSDSGWNFIIDSGAPDNITSGIIEGSLGLIDDVGAVTGTIPDGGVTDDNRPTFSGQATGDIDRVNIYDNGTPIGSAEVGEDGRWSFTPETDLAEGEHEFTVSAVDKAGNEGPQVSDTADGSWSFTVDTSAPGENALVEGSITLTDDVGPVIGTIDDGSITDDAQPTYSGVISSEGLADGVVSVNVYDNGTLIGSAAVEQSSGTWSFTPGSALASGRHSFTVAAVDAAGNVGPQVSGTADAAWDFTLLTSAPAQPSIENVSDDFTHGEDTDIGFLQKGQATNDGTLTVNGSAGADLTVQIWATDGEGNRVLVGEGRADENGRWSITTANLGADGTYDLTATAVNAAGVSSAETGAFPVVLDTVAPEAARADLMDRQGDEHGKVADGGVTDDRAPQLSGTGEPGATVTVYLDGATTPAGSAIVDEAGNWTLALSTLNDGEHSYQTKITDAAGNETRSESMTFTVDSSGVELTLDQANDNAGSITGAVLNGGLTDDSTPELQGTTLANAVVTIRDAEGNVLGTATADASGAWTFQLASVADGEHTWTAEVTNKAGNTAQATLTLTVDTAAPAAPTITSMEDDVGTVQDVWTTPGNATDDPAPTFTGKAEAGSIINLYDGDSVLGTVTADKDGNWSYTPTTNLVDGEHSISVTSTDAAGNESDRSAVWDFTLDTSTTAPVITTNTTDEIGGTAEPGATITITTPSNGDTTTVVADEDGNWSVQPNPIAVGETDVTVVATDPAGNTNSTVVDGPQDNTAPGEDAFADGSITLTDDVGPVTGTIADGSTTDDAQPTYSGVISSEGLADGVVSVNVYDNGTLIGSAAVEQSTGAWSFTPGSALASGSHRFTVAAVDAAGNVGPQVSGTADAAWDFNLLTSAPAQPSIENVSDDFTHGEEADIGFLQKGQLTNDGTLKVNGSAGPEMTVQIWAKDSEGNRVKVGEGKADETGRWSITTTNLGADGTYDLTATAVNAAGVSSAETGAFPIVLDTTAPEAAVANLMDDRGEVQGAVAAGGVTDDSALQLIGTGEPGAIVTVYLDGASTPVGSVEVDEDGNWTLALSSLSDGDHRYQTKITDAAGNETRGDSVSFTVDTSSPAITIAQANDNVGSITGAVLNGGITDDSTPELQGTTLANAVVTIRDSEGKVLGTATADASGAWKYQLTDVEDGEHTFTAEVTNEAGNTAQATLTLTVDATAPEAAKADLMDDQGEVQGPVAAGGVTDDRTPQLSGTGEPGATVSVILDGAGTPAGSVVVDQDGNWTLALGSLSDGDHTYQTIITDVAGNETRGESVGFTVDSSSVELTIDRANDNAGSITGAVLNGGLTDDSSPELQGTTLANAVVTIRDSEGNALGTATADASGAWKYQLTDVADGKHTWTAEVTNEAGNTAQATLTLTVDTTAPDAATVNIIDDQGEVQGTVAAGGVTDDRTPQLSGTGEPGATVSVILDGAGTPAGSVVVDKDGNWTLPLGTLDDGEHSFQTTITDAAGNKTTGESVSFTVDSSAAAITISQANDNVGSITGAVLNGGLTDDSTPELQGTTLANAVVTIRDAEGNVLGTTTSDAAGAWTFQLASVADGEHTWTAEVTNKAGNTAQATLTLTVDTAAPAAPTITSMEDDVGTVQDVWTTPGNATDDPAPTFVGTAVPGSVVSVYDGDNVLGAVTADKDGNWSYTPTTNLVDGEHGISVTSTDAAGNESDRSAVWDFTLDTSTTAPVITTNTTDEIGGTAEPGATITITTPSNGDTTTVVADEDGNWSVQPNPIAVGETDVTVVATDPAGNTNSTVVDGPQDSSAPDNITSGVVGGSITLTDDVEPVTGTIADGSNTNDARPTYAGQATDDIDHVNIYDKGTLIGSAEVGENGRWSFTPETALAAGDHEFTVSAVDEAGNEGPQMSGTADDGWNFTVDTVAPGENAIVEGSIILTDDVGPVKGAINDGSTTDDAQPTYSGVISSEGLADGVVSVNVYDNGTLIGSAAVDGSTGAWSFTPGSALASGSHGFTVAAVDAAGNEGPRVSGTADESWDFNLLTSAPAQPSIENVSDDFTHGEDADIGFLQKGQITNDGTLTLNGSAGPDLTVQIWAKDGEGNRVLVGEGQADENGRWSITTAELGDDGTFDLTAIAVNAAGVSSAETGTFPIVLDTTAPDAATAELMDDQGEVQGAVAAGGVTDDRTPQLSGTGEPGATVTVYLDGATSPAGSVEVDDAGNWTLALSSLSDGEHSYQIKIADAAGNETRGESVSFTVDSSTVELTLDQANDNAGTITGAVLNGGITDDSTPELQGTTLANAVVTIRDSEGNALGTATADASGAWTFQLGSVADGEHTWTAEVTNEAGNTAQATLTLTVDTTPPAAPVITAIEDDVGSIQFTSAVQGNVTDDPAPTFTGTAEAGSTITLYDGESVLGAVTADKDGNWSYTPTTNLVEGSHSVTATATDAAGNTSEASAGWNFILDITAPNVGISGNSAESLSGQSEPGALITVEDESGTKYTAVADQTGRWIIAPNPIEAGVSGKIYATDPAGNQGEALSFQGAALGSYDLMNESAQVNTTILGDQANPTTTRLADGRIVVVWQGDGAATTEVFMQMYEADGVHKIGSEQQINQRTNGNQDSPQVVALADGGFIIVYESYNGGLDNSGDGIIARRYGADGQAMTDEFLVNITTSGNQNRPSVLATADGGYVISWQDQSKNIVQRTYGVDDQPATGEVIVATGSGMGASGGPEMASFTDQLHSGMTITVWNSSSGPTDKSSTGVVGQIMGADGKPLGGAFQVNTTMDGSQNYPDVITLNDGSFVVSWDTNDSGANGSDVRAVHYTVDPATGNVSVKGTGDFIVNTYTDGKQYKPVGVALEDGGYLIIWGSAGGDGSGSAIYAQRYDANDHKVGREFIVNTTTANNQGYGGDSVDVTHILDATLMADGNVYITWQSDNVDDKGMGVEGIVVNPDASYYSEFTVNTSAAGNQTHSSVAALPGGGSIVVWQSSTGDGSGTCIKGQMLDAKGQPIGGEFTVNTTTSGDQLTPQVTVLPSGGFEVVWSSGAYIKGQKFTYTVDGNSQVNGVAASGIEFNVNTGSGVDHQTNPVITALANGGSMVVWQGTANGVWEILGRQYDAAGVPVGDQKVLATTSLGAPWALGAGDWPPLPTVTTLSDGKLAIAYTNKGTGYDSNVLVFDPATQTSGTSIVVNQTLTNDQASPVVTALGNGNFIVTWDSNNNGGPDQTGFSVWGRIFDAAGNALGNEFMINTATPGDQHLPIVVSREDGSFVVVFVSGTDSAPGAGTYGIYAQYFDANGNKIGQQMQINQLTYGDQIEVDATFLEGGQLYVTWTDQGVADGAGSAIKGRIVDLVETLGIEQETPQNDDPTTIDYQPSTEAVADSLPPNVGISVNNSDRLGGQTEPGATVTVINAKGDSHVAVADSKGAWHLEPNPLAVGEKGYIFAADTEGNSGSPVLIRGTALDGYDLLNESVQVNTTTAYDQANPTTTRLADGRIVVIWQSSIGMAFVGGLPTAWQTDVFMQLYEADGIHKIGTEQQINQRTANNQDSPQVVALADGGFLVVYESWRSTLEPDGDSVLARRYGSDGQAMTDEFLVNTTTSGNQNNPSAMATPDGGYTITWQDQNKNIVQRTYGADNQPATDETIVATGSGISSSGGPEMAAFTDAQHGGMYITVWNSTSGPSDTSSTGVVGQIFDANGKPLGGAFQVNTTKDGSQSYPDVITLKDGSFVVFWDSNDSGANGVDIRAVHYAVDAATGAVSVKGTGDFIVNTYTDGKQYKPVGVALEDGGYMIIWGSEGGDGDGSAIYAQRYDANDHKIGREFIVNTTTAGNQGSGGNSSDVTHILDATLMADGKVYITWQSDNVDGSDAGIEGIVVSPDASYYSEFTVNTSKAGDQSSPEVVSLPNGGLFAVWVSANGDGSGTGIKGQMLDAKGQPIGSEFTINSTTSGNQLTPVVLENGNIQVVWTSPASGSVSYIKGQQYTFTYDGDGNVNGLTAVGSEFNISSGTGAGYQAHPQITSLADGGYLVIWEAVYANEYKIYARQYNAEGSPVTEELTLSATGLTTGPLGNSVGWSSLPSVDQLSNGKVAIVFATAGSGYDSSLMMYDPVTHTVGSAAIVNQTTAGDQATASVSALDNGNFVVSWDSNNTGGPDQNGYGVWGRIYDANGQAVSNEFLINTVTAGDQHLARVVSRADGSFVAVFISATDIAPGAGTDGIYAQYFDSHGNKIGQQMQINQLTYGEQVEVNATFMEGGQLYVTWTDQGVGDGSGSAIKGRIVDLNETLGLSDDGNGLTHIEYQPAQFYVNGTAGNDSLDARGAITVDAKEGDDTVFINGTNFTSIDGGEGYDTLVWDSVSNFELGSVSSDISGIEVIHMGNSAAQTLVISVNDVLEMTKDNGEAEHTLKIIGDDGNSNKNGAKDTVNIDKSVWTSSGSQAENGVNYDVYVHNDDSTVKLIIQNGMNVI